MKLGLFPFTAQSNQNERSPNSHHLVDARPNAMGHKRKNVQKVIQEKKLRVPYEKNYIKSNVKGCYLRTNDTFGWYLDTWIGGCQPQTAIMWLACSNLK